MLFVFHDFTDPGVQSCTLFCLGVKLQGLSWVVSFLCLPWLPWTVSFLCLPWQSYWLACSLWGILVIIDLLRAWTTLPPILMELCGTQLFSDISDVMNKSYDACNVVRRGRSSLLPTLSQ
mmetsp:Transcript_5770/g.10319  ORF Transcript_5770/g.10319 Transcript_5770/m.10319 type:complete len:120 (-) Transcript_5770:3913-4272(-)